MPTRRIFLGLALASPFGLALPRPALASSPEVFSTGGVAIHGYDPVGYFTARKPIDGSNAFQVKWMGAVWRFANPDHMNAFEMNPHGYAPQYGGYCAYAMAQGAVATTVPDAWTVHQGKLYLNFSTGVRQLWKKDIPGYIEAANRHWPAALNG
ncbi:MAG: YHS domain-containing (seleno)protein [Paracoccaceae bacterium]